MKLFNIYLLFFFIFGFSKNAETQNLVPNSSFEQFTSCGGQLSNTIYWYNPSGGSPDYFNSCDITGFFDVPQNAGGFQYAHTGVAYAGFALYYIPGNNFREYIATKLTAPLMAGKMYCVEFYLSLAEYSKYSIQNVSVLFSSDSVSYPFPFVQNIPDTPQVNNWSIQYADTSQWMLYQAVYTAIGGEQYITIGNFNSNLNTSDSIVNNNATNDIAYYYIDDVSVYYCDEDTSSIAPIPNVFTPNGDDRNETFFITSTGLKKIDCKIYNRWGTQIYTISAPNDFWDGYTTSGEPCNAGVYYYVLTATGIDGKEYNFKGFLQLLK